MVRLQPFRIAILGFLCLIQTTCAFLISGISRARPGTAVRSDTSGSSNNNSVDASSAAPSPKPPKPTKPDILQPFLPAADPRYMSTGSVGDGAFIISRVGEPALKELSNENLLKILHIECSDLEVNTLMWKCLGYRFDETVEEWTAEAVFPKWKEKFPTPPDLVGMQRVYSKEIDRPSLKANQALVRSIPVDNKQSLKVHLKPYGFTGYQVCEKT
jgi:hypothetical protein